MTSQTASGVVGSGLSAAGLAEMLHEPLDGTFFPPTEDEQAPVIEAGLEPMLVVAGAGSGKTATMADRVVHQVAAGAVSPDEVLGVTFTRKAAGELRERIVAKLRRLEQKGLLNPADLLPEGSAAAAVGAGGLVELLAPTVATYHSYANSLVQEYGLQLGLEPETTMISDADAWQIVMRLVEEHEPSDPQKLVDLEVSPRSLASQVLKLVGDCSEHLIEDLDVVRSFLDAEIARVEALPMGKSGNRTKSWGAAEQKLLDNLTIRRIVVDLAEEYRRQKAELKVMDYGDLLVHAVRIAGSTTARGAEQEKYRLVMLDEFQDTSHAQLELFSRLFAGVEGIGVTAVGDPNQSIYGFRGASAGQLFSFLDRFTWTESATSARRVPQQLQLTRAWRNGQVILDAANRLVEPFREHQPRWAPSWKRHKQEQRRIARLRAGKGHRGAVRLGWYETGDAEAAAVADQLAAELAAGEESGERPTAAVLSRKRSHLSAVAEELARRGVPYEFVGLSGLLSTPEVVQVISFLQVIADASRSDALIRVLAGPKYQVPPRDLMRLNRLASTLVKRREKRAARAAEERAAAGESGAAGTSATDDVDAAAPAQEVAEMASLVEALAQLPEESEHGDLDGFSAEGLARLRAAQRDLQRLRGAAGLDLSSLIERIIEDTGLGVEVLARPGEEQHTATRQLDALIQHAESFVAQAPGRADLTGFLEWVDAAEEQENGLAQAAVEPTPGAVQLLTVHASKGLEWEVVAVVGLREGQFPSEKADHWLQRNGQLPAPLRGDAESLPQWESDQETVALWSAASGEATDTAYRKAEAERLGIDESQVASYKKQVKEFSRQEERRLVYVAVTRAERLLLATGARYYGATKGNLPSVFLRELAEVDGVEWMTAEDGTGESRELRLPEEVAAPGLEESSDPDDEAVAKEFTNEPNPRGAEKLGVDWPIDPLATTPVRRYAERRFADQPWRAPELEPVDDGEPAPTTRRPAVEASLQDVRAAVAEGVQPDPASEVEQEAQWVVDRFLAARRPVGRPHMPQNLSTSRFVELEKDSADVAQQYLRPVPKKPSHVMRRGTAVHAFIEDFYGHKAGLDGVEDPLEGDQHLDEAFGIAEVREALEVSPWGERQMAAMEIAMKTSLDGVTISGRIDAVFGTTADGDDVLTADFDRWQMLARDERNALMSRCSWHLVDWKTGRVPTGDDLRNKQLQLAIYRLAFSLNYGVDLRQIEASFYYVDHRTPVHAENLPDAEQLRSVIRSARRHFAE